jgi:hypothetical protein
MEVLSLSIRTLAQWQDRLPRESQDVSRLDKAIAQIQGDSGVLLRWHILGPMTSETASAFVEALHRAEPAKMLDRMTSRDGQMQLAQGTDGHIELRAPRGTASQSVTDSGDGQAGGAGALDVGPPADGENAVWLAASRVFLREETHASGLASSSGTLDVWLNGQVVHRRDQKRSYRPDSDRFAMTLPAGMNWLLVRVSEPGPQARALMPNTNA